MSRCGQYTPSGVILNPEHAGNGWREARRLKRALVGDQWMTPDTYDNCFSDPTTGAAVYLFLIHGWDETDGLDDFGVALVAYVGMSRQLAKRWEKHPTLTEIKATGRYVQRWFRPTPAAHLRAQELHLIKAMDPPWNIQGRKRGLPE